MLCNSVAYAIHSLAFPLLFYSVQISAIPSQFPSLLFPCASKLCSSVAILIDSMPLQRSTIQCRCHALLRFALPLLLCGKPPSAVALPNHALPSPCDVIRFTSLPMLVIAVPQRILSAQSSALPFSAMPLLRYVSLCISVAILFIAKPNHSVAIPSVSEQNSAVA